MTDIREAVAGVKNLGKLARNLLQVIEVVEEISNLADAHADAKSLAGRTTRETNLALEEGEAKLRNLNLTLEAAKSSITDAQDCAAGIVAEANAQANTREEDARHKSAEIISRAESIAHRLEDEFNTEKTRHEEWMKAAEAEYKKAADEVSMISVKLAELRKNIGAE